MARYFWDTNHYIYLFEDDPIFQPAVMRLRERMLLHRDELLTSAMTLGEIQVKGLKNEQAHLAATFRQRVLATSQIVNFTKRQRMPLPTYDPQRRSKVPTPFN